jgi:hypothetical protein
VRVQADTDPDHTPLQLLRPTLGNRICHALLREGYTTVEQVAATPDADLLDIAIIGPGSVAVLRKVIPYRDPVTGRSTPVLALSSDQIVELEELLDALISYATASGGRDIARRADAFKDSLRHRG